MTKAKKKMTKSTFVIIIMAVAMVAMLAFGGTFAYFTATTTEASDTATTGTVKLGANTIATLVDTNVVSGQQLFGGSSKVQVTSASNVDTYVFITFTVSMSGTGNQVDSKDLIKVDGDYCLEYTTAEGWEEVPEHTGVLAKLVPADTTAPMDVCTGIKFYGMSNSTPDTTGSLMGQTITVTIKSEAIQVIGEDDGAEMTPQEAYEVLHPVGG